jgi:hypothetical protein
VKTKIIVVDLRPAARAWRTFRSVVYLAVLIAGVITVDEDVQRVLG